MRARKWPPVDQFFPCDSFHMRADRLVATLLFLQARGRVTATEVAEELEVSKRRPGGTWRRCRSPASPCTPRPGGAAAGRWWAAPAPTSAGSPRPRPAPCSWWPGPPRRSRRRPRRRCANWCRPCRRRSGRRPRRRRPPSCSTRPAGGGRRRPPRRTSKPSSRRWCRGCRSGSDTPSAKGAVSERTVHPLGLVSKGTTWYLLGDTDAGRRTFRVWRVRSVEANRRAAAEPPDFDLPSVGGGGRQPSTIAAPCAPSPAWSTRASSAGYAPTSAPASPSGSAEDDGRTKVELGFPELRAGPGAVRLRPGARCSGHPSARRARRHRSPAGGALHGRRSRLKAGGLARHARDAAALTRSAEMGIFDKAKDLAGEHEDKVKEAVDKLAD